MARQGTLLRSPTGLFSYLGLRTLGLTLFHGRSERLSGLIKLMLFAIAPGYPNGSSIRW